jgi:SAM-dependent methyltransferase
MNNALARTGFPATYERVLVPAIFDRWARDLIERARPVGPSDRILDLGCGTGIVSRRLRDRLGGAARVTGVDASAAMLEMARSLAPELEWREANAMALPFDDGSFELVLSQQMLQFVPDRAAALREVRRVLRPGGRVVLSTWRPRGEQPLYEILGTLAEAQFGASSDPRFAFGDGDALRALLVDAGFSDVQVQTVTLTEHYASVPARLFILPMGFTLELPDDERERRLTVLERDVDAAIQRHAVDGGYAFAASANLVTARVAAA